MTDYAYKVRVLAEAGDCPTDGTCFVLGEVMARPGKVQRSRRSSTVRDWSTRTGTRSGPGRSSHPYERYECEWGYALTSAAGEDIRVLHPGEHRVPDDLVDHDFWLLDDQHAVRMHYSDSGEFLGASVEPEQVEVYRTARRVVLGTEEQPVAEEFASWWSRHPELRRGMDGKVT